MNDDDLSPAAERGIELFSIVVVVGLIIYFDVYGLLRGLVEPPIKDFIHWLGWFAR
jgi:hypothetical protein